MGKRARLNILEKLIFSILYLFVLNNIGPKTQFLHAHLTMRVLQSFRAYFAFFLARTPTSELCDDNNTRNCLFQPYPSARDAFVPDGLWGEVTHDRTIRAAAAAGERWQHKRMRIIIAITTRRADIE